MKNEITMKFEVVENGLIVRKREGNKWGTKRWVVGFKDAKTDIFSDMLGGESVAVGNLVRDALFGVAKQTSPSKPTSPVGHGHTGPCAPGCDCPAGVRLLASS